ncbi:spondin domain-containing protein [Paludisphaera mucosa]|uniref:Spondin domain-containing protein n=1 Tax=Paludisphaera mucosa TaxID=3030827 RepID=A0ABT6FBY6_9BACT|nr:spondin domain-containing protein [Paludisphaera mucosa]MDG3005060.1 spondin domain-containing protein [Paludisphaera mucosa]
MLNTHAWRARSLALVALLSLLGGASAVAGPLAVTVTNNQPGGGFGISPVWLGVHDGTYRTFTPGEAVGPALQALAELGDPSALAAAFAGHGSGAVAGSAPIGPGGSASTILDVADPTTQQYLSFASMVVPSNDFFFGNADPLAFRLFDAQGRFTGPITIQIFGAGAWDAGSEVNDIGFGAAFIAGDDAHDHVAEGGVITRVFGGSIDQSAYLASIDGRATPYGYNISHLISPGDLIATITITSVPEPSTFLMLGVAAVGVGLAARRSRPRG